MRTFTKISVGKRCFPAVRAYGTLVLLALAGLLLLAACGGNGEIDACALVTKAEAEEVLGQPVSEPTSQPFGGATCTYLPAEAPTSGAVSIIVLTGVSKDEFHEHVEAGADPVPDVGDEAFWHGFVLSVLKGDVEFVLGVKLPAGDNALEAAKGLALKVVERIP